MRIAFTFLLLLAAVGAQAATINASSASRADVAAAISSASNGDTVVIPAGSASWTTGISFTKGITVQGDGVGSTIITISGLPNNWDGGAFEVTQVNTYNVRITGIQFNGVEWSRPAIRVDGTPANALFRIDNCQFNSPGDLTAINTWGGGRGVIDHCWFESDGTHYGAFICHYPEQSTAGTTSYGITDHTGTVDMVMLALEIKE